MVPMHRKKILTIFCTMSMSQTSFFPKIVHSFVVLTVGTLLVALPFRCRASELPHFLPGLMVAHLRLAAQKHPVQPQVNTPVITIAQSNIPLATPEQTAVGTRLRNNLQAQFNRVIAPEDDHDRLPQKLIEGHIITLDNVRKLYEDHIYIHDGWNDVPFTPYDADHPTYRQPLGLELLLFNYAIAAADLIIQADPPSQSEFDWRALRSEWNGRISTHLKRLQPQMSSPAHKLRWHSTYGYLPGALNGLGDRNPYTFIESTESPFGYALTRPGKNSSDK